MFFWRCPITAVAGKYNVSFSCQRGGEIFERKWPSCLLILPVSSIK